MAFLLLPKQVSQLGSDWETREPASGACRRIIYKKTRVSTLTDESLSHPAVIPCGPWFYRAIHGAPRTDTAPMDAASTDPVDILYGNAPWIRVLRAAQQETLSTDGGLSSTTGVTIEQYGGQNENETFEVLFEEKEPAALLRLDPTKWKDQDHYAVLGLGKMRWKATEEDLKRAYRRKVLKHHPDKKQQGGSDNFFKCIQKAYELLSDPQKRRQFDSVDPSFDDEIPTKFLSNQDLYSVFNSIFARNAYFSQKKPVPSFGNENSSREQVEAFYNFWSTFESWRSFELLDEQNPDMADNRDERRWIEKQNKAERARRKKQETARILKLVDTAMSLDPRVQKFKENDKAAKEAKRLAREMALKKAEEEAKAAEEALRLEREKHEEEQKKQREEAKKQKEQRKRLIKNNRKAIRTLLSDKYDYFSQGNATVREEMSKKLEDWYQFVADDVAQLEMLLASLEKCTVSDQARSVVEEEYQKMTDAETMKKSQEQERLDQLRRQQAEREAAIAAEKNRPWTEEEAKLLIKAANMFPGGTLNRWETVSEYVAQHLSVRYPPRGPDEMVRKSKELRQSSANINTQKFERRKNDFVIRDAPTMKVDENTAPETSATVETPQPRPWAASEQAQLEAAMKKYPASEFKGAERWDKVAAMVEGRTKKEVIARVKELIKAVKSK